MGWTGVIAFALVVAIGAAAVALKPGADGFAAPAMRAFAESSEATSPQDLTIEGCATALEACAQSLREFEGAHFTETDYLFARTATISWVGHADVNCIGAFDAWNCALTKD